MLTAKHGVKGDSAIGCDYVTIFGLGKSGSKRVLKLFDLHEWTHCRCEPNELKDSVFDPLVSREFGDETDRVSLENGWDAAVDEVLGMMGDRDNLPTPEKAFWSSTGKALPLYRMFKHDSVRRALGMFVGQWRTEQWRVPRWYFDQAKFAKAVGVLKLGPCPAWAKWLASNRPGVSIVHVVRHPAGFVNSYRGRFLANQDEQKVAEDNRARLRRLVEHDPQFAQQFGDIEKMGAVEAELWYWFYCTQAIDAGCSGAKRYLQVTDEQVVARPDEVLNSLYRLAGLADSETAKRYVEQMKRQWQSVVKPWRQLVSGDDVELVEKFLDMPFVQGWWTDDQLVSDYHYQAYTQFSIRRKYSCMVKK